MYYENRGEKRGRGLLVFLAMLVIIVLLVALNLRLEGIQNSNEQNYSTEKLKNEVEEKQEPEEGKKDYAFIKEATKSIVGISKMKQTGILSDDENGGIESGSGVIVTENGYILTNHHVAGNKYSNCYVTLESGKVYDGNVVWADKNIDLAIVKISIAKSDYMRLGDSDKIDLGEDVYAIGNPIGFEFQRTVTKGIISGLNRTIKVQENDKSVYMEDLIQTDSTINNGNSGGALINLSGELLGINTIKITDAHGIGFAVPVNIVKPIIEKLSETGKFDEPYLGIYGYDKEVIPYLNSSVDLESGIYIDSIALDGPVYNSGIIVGDIITKIDNVEINKMSELKKYIYSKNPGDTVKLIVHRKFKDFEVDIKLNYNV